jgi:hypothetical protein
MPKKHQRGSGQTLHQFLKYYDRKGKPLPDWMAWTRKNADPEYRHVASTVLPDGKRVSTIWIGLNYSSGRGPPLIFETMVFPSKRRSFSDLERDRYSTEKDALKGHKRLVKKWSKPPQ